jgi:FtsX-like permease family
MGRFPIWLAARSALRRTWVGASVVAVLLGIVGGVVTAALWGADRVETSYERLVRDVDAPDLFLIDTVSAAEAAGLTDHCDEECADVDAGGAAIEQLRAEPAVEEVTEVIQQFVSIRTASGRFLGSEPAEECSTGAGELNLTWSNWPRTGSPPARIVSGRLPDEDSTNEVALSSITARRAGVDVGDSVFLTGPCGDEDTDEVSSHLDPPIELKVVGVLVGFLDVRPPGQSEYYEDVYVSQQLIRQTGAAGFDSQAGFAAWLRPGTSVADLSPDTQAGIIFDLANHSIDVREDLTADALALRLFAIAALVSAIAVLSQLLSSSVQSAVSLNRSLMFIGARRRDLASLGYVHGALIGAGAAIVAGVTTVGVAPVVPLGAADPIDQGSNIGLVVSVGLLGAVATLAAVLILAIIPAILAARASDRPPLPPAVRWPARVAEALHFGPAASLGTRFALEPATGPRPTPIRSGIGAIVVALAVVTGVITFGSALDHLRTTPRLVGWNWDFFVFGNDQDIEDLAQTISERPDVERSGMGIVFSFGISLADDFTDFGAFEAVFGFDASAGGVGPVVLEGRSPQGPDELLLAPRLAALHGLSVGDVTTVYGLNVTAFVATELGVAAESLGIEDITAQSFEVVGIGVIPVFDGRLDSGAALTLDGFARALPSPSRAEMMQIFDLADPDALLDLLVNLEGPVGLDPSERQQISEAGPDATSALLASWSDQQFARLIPDDLVGPQVVFVDIAPGEKPHTVLQRLADDGLVDQQFVAETFDQGTDRLSPERLVKLDLSDVAWIPTSFGYLMGLTALAALGFVVTSAARARQGAVATLRALGLSPSQTRRAIAYQSVVTVGVALAIALPIGVIGGRIAWHRYATGLQVVPEPVTPWPYLAVLVAAAFTVALVVSLLPGWRAAHQSPIKSLRSE